MAAPRFDEIEGEDLPQTPPTAPRFDDIAGEDLTPDGTPKMGAARAATLGVAQGGTMGFADEIGGAVASFLPEALGGVPESSVKLGPAAMPNAADSEEEFQAKANLIEGMANTPTSYELVRDRMRAEQKKAQQEQGAAYMAGEIAGGVAGSIAGNILVPGGGVVGRAAMEGAGAGLGTSEADLLKGEVGEAAADTAIGGAVGGLAGMAGGAIASRLPGAARATQEGAEGMARERALKAAGYIQKDLPKQVGPRARLDAKAGLMLDEPGLITAGASAETVGERAALAAKEYGEIIGKTLQQADATGATFAPDNFLSQARQLVDEIGRDPVYAPQARRLRQILRGYEKLADDAAEGGLPFTFQQANDLKGSLQGTLFNGQGDLVKNAEFANQVQRLFTQEIDAQLENVLTGDAAILFKDAKLRYGAMVDAAKKGLQGGNRSLGNNFLGLPDYLFAEIAASVGGGPLAGMAAGAASKAVRSRGSSAAAAALRGLSGNALLRKVAELSPDMLGEFAGPITAAIARGAQGDDAALSTVDYVLQHTSPQYRAMKAALAKEAQ